VLKLLPAQLPWWLGGPGIGLSVVARYGLADRWLAVCGVRPAAVGAPIERRHGERCAAGSAGSLAAKGTFVGVAVAVAFVETRHATAG
jgi:hypothetical protein